MPQVILDINSITPEEINEATEVLQKEITAQVNDAMRKGLTRSLDRYSQEIAKKVSGTLKDSILDVIQNDLAKGFQSLFNPQSFTSNISKSLKTSIEGVFKSLSKIEIDIKPTVKPEDRLTMKDVFDGDTSLPGLSGPMGKGDSGVAAKSPGIIITDPVPYREPKEEDHPDASREPGGVMPLPLYEIGRDKSPSLESIEDLFQNLVNQKVPEPEAREMAERFAESPLTQETNFEDSKQVAVLREFNKAVNAQAVGTDTLSEKIEELTEATEDSAEATTKATEAADKASKLDLVKGKEGGLDKSAKKLVDWTDSFRITIGMWFMSIPRMVIGMLKETILSFTPRQREAAISASTVIGSDDMTIGYDVYQNFLRKMDTALSNSPFLRAYGGEGAKDAYLGLKGVTGGVDLDDVRQGHADVRNEMESLAAKALLAGMNLDDFANKVKEGITALGLSRDRSERFILSVADRAKELNISFDSLYSNINAANGSLRQWGHSLYESYGIASRFANALEQGRMSMGDIIEYASALHSAEEGTSLFLLEQLMGQGGIGGQIADAIRNLSQGDPMAERNLWRRVSEGHQNTARDLGLDMSDAALQREFRRSIFKLIDNMVPSMAGENVYAQNEIRRKLLQEFLGIAGATSETVQEVLQEIYINQRGVARGIAPTGLSIEEKVEKVRPRMDADVGTWDRVVVVGKRIFIEGSDALRGGLVESRGAMSLLEQSFVGDDTSLYDQALQKLEDSRVGTFSHQENLSNLSLLNRHFQRYVEQGNFEAAQRVVNVLPMILPTQTFQEGSLKEAFERMRTDQMTSQDREIITSFIQLYKKEWSERKTFEGGNIGGIF